MRPATVPRRKILIEQPAVTPDGQGGWKVTGWSTFMSTMASIDTATGQERFFAQGLNAIITHKVRFKYRSDKLINADMRLNYTVNGVTRIFQIHAIVNEDERNRWMTILCEEGAGS